MGVEPWFGQWPPDIREGEEDMTTLKGLFARWEARAVGIAAGLLLVGVVLLFVSYFRSGLAGHILEGLGIAGITALILGISLDWVFRQRLTEDAFKASIGYLLPSELKDEMRWIYGHHILCTVWNQTIELSAIDSATMRLRVKTYRVLQNIGRTKATAHLGRAIDEWFHANGEPSSIVDVAYKQDTEPKHLLWEKRPNATIVTVQEALVDLTEKQEVIFEDEYIEIKRQHDFHLMTYRYPVVRPLITIVKPQDVSVEVAFGHRETQTAVGPTGNSYRLNGTLLPEQAMIIRWWVKRDIERWLDNEESTAPKA